MKCHLINENFTSDYTKQLLQSRGITDVAQYLVPPKEYLQDPEALDNIEAAAMLYLANIGANKHILIITDSDNDGFTSAAIIYQYTNYLKPDTKIDYWLHDGKQHGLSDFIDKLLELGHVYDLIILPDSSSNDYEYHEQLKTINTPCLILDHHLTDMPISDNAIIVNNQLSTNYKNKELTGAGVVYQFVRYVDKKLGIEKADDYLDLAAWGIIGDMGSVLELENRYIIYHGLHHIKNQLLLALMQKQAFSITGSVAPTADELQNAMNPISVAFYIVPLINAMIRIGTEEEKQRLFLAFVDGNHMVPSGKRGAKGTLERVAVEACRECTNARARQNRIKDATVEALTSRIQNEHLLDNRVLFVRLDDRDTFPAELNGLIAMQLSAQFKRPTIVARLNSEGFIRGSARGVNESELTNFKQFLTDSGFFEYAQGHANAFGCSIENLHLHDFHEYANKALANIDFGESVYDVNFVRDVTSLDLSDLIADIAQYEGIWGQGNATPLIYIKNLNVNASQIQVIGKNADTLKIEYNGITYIKFHAKADIERIKAMSGMLHIEIVGRAQMNVWMDRYTPQIIIESLDIRQNKITDF